MLIHEKLAINEWKKKFIEQPALSSEEWIDSPEISPTMSPITSSRASLHKKGRRASMYQPIQAHLNPLQTIPTHINRIQRRRSTTCISLDPEIRKMKTSNRKSIHDLFIDVHKTPYWEDVQSQFMIAKIQGTFEARMEFLRKWTIYALNDQERLYD